jgi:hypothetical protein
MTERWERDMRGGKGEIKSRDESGRVSSVVALRAA